MNRNLKWLTSTVGLPLESRISRALTPLIVDPDMFKELVDNPERKLFGVTKANELPIKFSIHNIKNREGKDECIC